jgi:splicing factor 1
MIPDGQNELRKLQLRELALLNGTLRPEDILSGARCANCGSDQHKTYELINEYTFYELLYIIKMGMHGGAKCNR